jgi:hypothetical protein
LSAAAVYGFTCPPRFEIKELPNIITFEGMKLALEKTVFIFPRLVICKDVKMLHGVSLSVRSLASELVRGPVKAPSRGVPQPWDKGGTQWVGG